MALPEALLFDLDGVLLDTEPLHGQAWAQAASVFGTSLKSKQILSLQGRRRNDCANQIIKWINKPITVEEFLLVHKPISQQLLAKVKEMPGANRLVKWCHAKKLPMALVSSSSSSSVAFKSDSHDWLSLIKTRVLGDDVLLKQGKPNPDPYLLAAHKLEVNPKACWALEDSLAGTKAALGAGCIVWVLNKEKQIDKHEKSFPTKNIISHLDEIFEKLNILS